MEDKRICLLDGRKICDDCRECDRCDIDPNKLCDNCFKCLALDEDKDFRSMIVEPQTVYESAVKLRPVQRKSKSIINMPDTENNSDEFEVESLRPDPDLVAYWEKRLAEYGEAPVDDEFGEARVNPPGVLRGVRKRKPRRT